ncbi:MAG: carbohydrate-binding protein, partial [Verrucomicrobiota bacterium]
SYLRGNLPPIAKAMASATSGSVPLKTTLSAKGSRDPEGSALTYAWTLQPSGKLLGTGEELAATLEQPGNFSIELVVADAAGEKSSVSLPVVVGNTAPVVKIDQPQNGDFFEPGKKIDYTLSVVDAEDGASSAKPLEFGMRTVVTSAFLPADGKGEAIDPGLSLMRKSDCFNCHAIDGPLVGPALTAIADRYRKQPGIEEILNKKVRLGGNGAWGEVPMLAHPQHTEDEVAIMLHWMLGLEAGKGGPTLTKGLQGQITAPNEKKPGSMIIEALYTDLGSAPAGELVGKTTIALRGPRLEAEDAEVNGPKIMGAKGASNKKALGSTSHGHNILFKDCNVSKVQSVTVRTAVGNAVTGSKVEVHLDSPSGPLVATVEIPNTGGWDSWAETKAPLNAATGRHDLFVVLVNPGKSGLMNLDWVEFGF